MRNGKSSGIFSFVLFFLNWADKFSSKRFVLWPKVSFPSKSWKASSVRGIYDGLLTCSPYLRLSSPSWLSDYWSDVHFLMCLRFVYFLDFHSCETLGKRILLLVCFHGFTWARLAPLL